MQFYYYTIICDYSKSTSFSFSFGTDSKAYLSESTSYFCPYLWVVSQLV